MRRREFITFLGSAMAARPLVVCAQQPAKIARIGFLGLGSGSAFGHLVERLRIGLLDLGYVEGKDIVIEFRWADTVEEMSKHAAELAGMNVDVIFAGASTHVEAARQATKTIPIVFGTHADPVGLGHVASLARPGGNITGLSVLLTELVAKQLEILKEAVPQATRIGVLFSPTAPSHGPALQAIETAGQKLGFQLHMAPVRTTEDFDGVYAMMARERVGGFQVVVAPPFILHRARVAELALKHRLPAIFASKENVEAGGLMSYGADLGDLYRRAAVYVDRILKGAKPADLPVEQASKFQLVINLKTAKALGLTIPATLLARADEVIE